MSKLVFDADGARYFERGVSNVALYVKNDQGGYENGVAFNGVINVTESPEGAEPTPFYADNIKYANILSNEDFKASIEVYQYPDEFKPCIGEIEAATGLTLTQQARKSFGLVYRTEYGNDENSELGYKIHIVYNCTASVAERAHDTINDTPELETMSWDISTTPVEVDVTGSTYKPTAHLVIDSTKADSTKLTALLGTLFGTDNGEATLPTPAQVIAALQ